MSQLKSRPKVWIGRADNYDKATLQAVLERGFKEMGPTLGKTVAAKCNWVLAHPVVARHCYTRPEVVDQALEQIFKLNPQANLTFIGNSGAGTPTAIMARRACGEAAEFRSKGFWTFTRKFPGKVFIHPTDEARHIDYRLSLGPAVTDEDKNRYQAQLSPQTRYWKSILTSAELSECDSLVWFPKLKSNVLGQGLTGACKLGGIGLLLDENRMDGHNYHNDRRIADMMEVARPDLIVTDAIEIAWGGNQMTEPGKHLGIVMMADNPVAHDVVACHLFGLDVMRVGHVRLAGERGWGPLRLEDIDVVTEIPLETLQARVSTFGHHGDVHVEDFAEKFKAETGFEFPMEVISGLPYEHAGAQGVFLDWLYFTFDFKRLQARMAKWPRAAVLIGEFEHLPTDPNAKVYLVGARACQRFDAQVKTLQNIVVPSFIHEFLRGPVRFQKYERPDGGRGWAVHMDGNPPTHRDFILGFFIGSFGRMLAPLLRVDLIIDSYLLMIGTWWRRRENNATAPRSMEASQIKRMQAYRPTSEADSSNPSLADKPVAVARS